MNVGDKYVIEIADIVKRQNGEKVGFTSCGFAYNDLDLASLEKYNPDGYDEGYKAGQKDALTIENCIVFLQKSGWMAKHDKELTKGETSKSIRSYAQGFKDGFTHAKEIDEEAVEEFESDENFDLGYAAGSKATELVSEAYYEKGKIEGEREGYNKGYKTGYEEGLRILKANDFVITI